MEQAQSQASCRESPSCACSCLEPAQLLHTCLLHEQGGSHPTSLHPQEGSARPHNTKTPHEHLQGLTPTLSTGWGQPNSSGNTARWHRAEAMEKGIHGEFALSRDAAKALVQTRDSASSKRMGMTAEGRAKTRKNLGF